MSFVGVKGDKNAESVNGDKKKDKQKVETPRSKDKDNNLEKSRILKDKKDKADKDDEKLQRELEKSKNVIADLKDQLIYSNKERDFYFEKFRLIEEY